MFGNPFKCAQYLGKKLITKTSALRVVERLAWSNGERMRRSRYPPFRVPHPSRRLLVKLRYFDAKREKLFFAVRRGGSHGKDYWNAVVWVSPIMLALSLRPDAVW